jgi:hypothetical protein
MNFGCKMRKCVNAWSAKVKPLNFALVVKKFEIFDESDNKLVSGDKLLWRDFALMDKSHTRHQLTIVAPINFREHAIEYARPQSIDVVHKFAGLITTGNFLSRVARRTVKRSRKIGSGACDCLAVGNPYITPQNGPIPEGLVDLIFRFKSAPPKTQKKFGDVEGCKVHQICTTATGKRKSVFSGQPAEYTGLPYPSLPATFLILGFG